jgi:tRNA(Arg) A34 adenosine deaminase TadA
MREAIRLARAGAAAGDGGPFGAVVVKDGVIVGRGWNQVLAAKDPTAHAEIVAIRDACARLGGFSLDGCEIYASCEPCPMCLGAIYWARLAVVHHAAGRKDAARAGFDDAAFHADLKGPTAGRRVPSRQLLRDEAVAVMEEWLARPDRRTY